MDIKYKIELENERTEMVKLELIQTLKMVANIMTKKFRLANKAC